MSPSIEKKLRTPVHRIALSVFAFAVVLQLFPQEVSAQSYVDQQVNLANKVQRETQEAIARSDAHVEDMKEIGVKVWKAHFEVIWDAIEDCKSTNANSIKSKKYVVQDSKEITKFTKKYSEDIEIYINSTKRVKEIFKKTKESACYPGFERNLEAYIDCMHATYRFSASSNATSGAYAALSQFEVLKKKSDEYVQCTLKNNYINDKNLENIANSIDISGEFYVDMAKRFSRDADAIR